MTVSRFVGAVNFFTQSKAAALCLYVVASALLIAAYALNLGSAYAPTNGDEMVYLHIARMTSESGHWLPLQSALEGMRNTKPPLLFWHAMLAGDGGSWTLFDLRLPYVTYTLLTAALVAWTCKQLIGVRPQLILAVALYLGFFSTYRYGRPVLSSGIESFYLFASCAWLAAKPKLLQQQTWRAALLVGLLMAPALLSKSFALAAPVGLWLCLAYVSSQPKPQLRVLIKAGCVASLAVLVGLAIFALWFVFDPDPTAVWREFVLGENVSTKFATDNYWLGAVKGVDSMWGLWLAPLINAGLLFPLVLGLLGAAWRDRAGMPHAQRIVWLWVFAWLFVFMWPNQRSARYVIPIMPALAVLLTLYAQEIRKKWWCLANGLVFLGALALALVAWRLQLFLKTQASSSYSVFACIGLVLLLGLSLWSCITSFYFERKPWLVASLTATSAVLWLVMLGQLSQPFDSQRFTTTVAQSLAGQRVMAPQNFKAQFERFQFAIPAHPRAVFVPYTGEPQTATLDALFKQAPYAIVSLPLDSFNVVECTLCGNTLASRLVLRSRQQPAELTWQNLLHLENLLIERELLIRSTATPAESIPTHFEKR